MEKKERLDEGGQGNQKRHRHSPRLALEVGNQPIQESVDS